MELGHKHTYKICLNHFVFMLTITNMAVV